MEAPVARDSKKRKRKTKAAKAAATAAEATTKSAKISKTEEKPAKKKRELAPFKNKQKVLILSSRGVTHRYRHLMNDVRELLPHGKKESKFDVKAHLPGINEVADLNNCNNCIFFECRKQQDLYMWVSKTPNGPSAKFLVLNGTLPPSPHAMRITFSTYSRLGLVLRQ